jgi:hypothetical protein
VPVLAVFALPHVPERWIRETTDPGVRDAGRAYFATIDALTEKQAKAVATGVPNARVVRMPGLHSIFISSESDVRQEMRTFIGTLK